MNSRVSEDFPGFLGVLRILVVDRQKAQAGLAADSKKRQERLSLIRKRYILPTRFSVTLAAHTREKRSAEGRQMPIRLLQAAE